MNFEIPSKGGATPELMHKAHRWWMDAAKAANINMKGFKPNAPLSQRIAWAARACLEIAAALSRYSTKLQKSTESQIRQIVEFAARKGLYLPPEFICVDEGQKGRRQRRDGLDRITLILREHYARVLLLFKVSRLLRTGYLSFKFVQENVVDEGLRAISISQGIDTSDLKTWKGLMYLHGMMDDMLLDTIGDHCRAELQSLFQQGFVIGALTVGYVPVEVPGAPLTNRGLPRTRPAIDEKTARLINQHFDWITDGMGISEGRRRWVKAGGRCDPRSTLGYMSRPAYRRMLSNSRYTGLWAFGRKRNLWSAKRDYTTQVDQPETEVKIVRAEELRILSDEKFLAMQKLLAKLKTGPRGPRKAKLARLWDLTTELFHCAHCKVRFYQTGAHGKGMQCKRGDACPRLSAVKRKEAVQAVCRGLQELITRDHDMLQRVIGRAEEIDAGGDDPLLDEIDKHDRRIVALSNKIDDLYELVGQGSDTDRREIKAKIRAAQSERTTEELARARLLGTAERVAKILTPEDVSEILGNFTTLLEDGAAGNLGEDAAYKALAVFKRLVGGRILVHVEPRPARTQTNVRGTFRPDLLGAVKAEADLHDPTDNSPAEAVEVWLREPPFLDRYAERAYRLIDVDGHSFRSAAEVMQAEGLKLNSGKIWQLRKRYYEMIGETPPDRPYNGGEPRQSL